MMEKKISKCGIICTDCNAYQATINNSNELRKKTSEEWSKMFGVDIAPDTINCLGCQSSDSNKLFSHCKVCKIRSCATEKGHRTCASCPDYGCKLLTEIWSHDESIKKNLDQLRVKNA